MMNVIHLPPGNMPESTTTVQRSHKRHHKRKMCVHCTVKLFYKVREVISLLPACKCSQRALMFGRVKRAGGHPVVTAFQDLCLGAPLSDVFLLLPLERVAGDTTKNRTQQEGTTSPVGHFPKKCLSLLSRKLILETHWTPYQGNQTSERTSATRCCCTNRSAGFT